MAIEKQPHRRIGIAVAVALGLVTAAVATIAAIANSRTANLSDLDFSEGWDEILGI